jgi:hypothetical protein
MKAVNIMIQAAFTREALNSHSAPIAAITRNRTDAIRPIMVSILLNFPSSAPTLREGAAKKNAKKG